jgi:hypothetical protein
MHLTWFSEALGMSTWRKSEVVQLTAVVGVVSSTSMALTGRLDAVLPEWASSLFAACMLGGLSFYITKLRDENRSLKQRKADTPPVGGNGEVAAKVNTPLEEPDLRTVLVPAETITRTERLLKMSSADDGKASERAMAVLYILCAVRLMSEAIDRIAEARDVLPRLQRQRGA